MVWIREGSITVADTVAQARERPTRGHGASLSAWLCHHCRHDDGDSCVSQGSAEKQNQWDIEIHHIDPLGGTGSHCYGG